MDEVERWNPRSPELSWEARAEVRRIDNAEAAARRHQEAEANLPANWTLLGMDNVMNLAEHVEDRTSEALRKIASNYKFNSAEELESRRRLASINELTHNMIVVYASDHMKRGQNR